MSLHFLYVLLCHRYITRVQIDYSSGRMYQLSHPTVTTVNIVKIIIIVSVIVVISISSIGSGIESFRSLPTIIHLLLLLI